MHKAEEAGRSGCSFLSERQASRRQGARMRPGGVSLFGHSFFGGLTVMPEQAVCIPIWFPRRQFSAKVRKEGGYGRSDVAIFMCLLLRGIAVGAVGGD